MVKADCYNHGFELVDEIESLVDGFGVCTVEEGKTLRKRGINKSIRVAGFFHEETGDLVKYGLIPMAGDFASLMDIKDSNIEADIKFNSGMNRLGFDTEDIPEIKGILSNSKLKVKSLDTHFAYSDIDNLNRQKDLFLRQCGEFSRLIHPKNAGGSALLIYPEEFAFLDEIRVGIALYGYMPVESELPLKQAMTVSAPVFAVRTLKRGDKLGYGGLYSADKDVKIGILRIGYYDGLPRAAKGAEVLINGKKTWIIGNVCMDFCFVNLDGIEAKVGDNAEIIGSGCDANKLACHCGTIPYEILMAFKGDRANRILIK